MTAKPLVRVDFTGTDLVTNTVFDTTNPKTAQAAGIFDARRHYEPATLLLGLHEWLPALETELQTMAEGQTKTVELEPQNAFGNRSADHIRLISAKDFAQQKMTPIVGMVIEADGRQGRVQSVSGGRVRVDFNHPLAGKKVRFELTLLKKITDKKEQVQALLDKYFYSVPRENQKISIAQNAAIIEIKWPKELENKTEVQVLQKFLEKLLVEHAGFEKAEFKDAAETKKTEKTAKDQKEAESAMPKKSGQS